MARSFRKTLFFPLAASCLIFLHAAGRSPARNSDNRAPALQQQGQEVEEESFKISVDVSLVTTDVTVVGTPVSELQPEDFIIYDDNVTQEVSYFSQDQLPLAIAVLVDASESIRDYLPMLQLASYSTLRRLKPEDQVSLHSFNANRYRLCDLTEDRLEIAEKIGKIKIAFGTNIFDTIYDATTNLRSKAPRRRRAIILVSDNCHVVFGGSSYHSPNKCLSELLETSTILYNIKTPGIGGWGCSESEAEIQRLVSETGGEAMDVRQPVALQPALEKIVSNLRKQYTLGFNPSAPGKSGSFHKLTVKFKSENRCPGCRILSRSGYYAGIAPPSPVPEKERAAKKSAHSAEKMDQLLIERSILTAGEFNMNLPGIPFEVAVAGPGAADSQPQMKVDLKIDASSVHFRTVDSLRSCKLRVVIFYANKGGRVLGSDWKMIEGSMSSDAYDRAVQSGIRYSATIPVKVKEQMLKIVIYDEESDKIGSRVLIPQ